MSGSASVSLKEYLKKYQDGGEEEKKKKKRKKKTKPGMMGVLVVDEDPVWQKPVVEEEEQDDYLADEEKPQVDEDIEVKRLKRLEQLRNRPYHAISEDGSGWVAISDAPSNSNLNTQNSDMSPPRRRTRNDSPSPEQPESKHGEADDDLSPPRQQRRRYDSPSPEPDLKHRRADDDLSPPRPQRRPHHSPSPAPESKQGEADAGLSPPRQQRRRYDSPSPEPESKRRRADDDLSPPRQQRRRHHAPSPEPYLKHGKADNDLSPPRPQRRHYHSPLPRPASVTNISPPHRPHSEMSGNKGRKIEKYDAPDISPRRSHRSTLGDNSDPYSQADPSPPRKSKKDFGGPRSPSLSSQKNHTIGADSSRLSTDRDLSPPRANWKEPNLLKEGPKTGLVKAEDIKEEIVKTRKDDWLRFKDMDPSISGRGAEPVYRDKITGDRISKEEYLKSQRKEEKLKEIKLEWGKGLAQKREAEARQLELEAEKEKPFARTRDDPELDKMLKNRLRWGDPMAHLVKRKQPEPVLTDFSENEKMKESGFVIPQDIPNHSWLKRGLDAAPNRYGIRPGRHWDGVDCSNGFEKELFKRMNEKQATEHEAYLWSVSDM
ncbi:Bud13 [Dillenia turbinata]|uniref:Bud13 n=1 Tax=Dillenia turbinata TaxID=194707 RepID=A0AAN8UPC3_9MAGN